MSFLRHTLIRSSLGRLKTYPSLTTTRIEISCGISQARQFASKNKGKKEFVGIEEDDFRKKPFKHAVKKEPRQRSDSRLHCVSGVDVPQLAISLLRLIPSPFSAVRFLTSSLRPLCCLAGIALQEPQRSLIPTRETTQGYYPGIIVPVGSYHLVVI